MDRQDGSHLAGLFDVPVNEIGPLGGLSPVEQRLGGFRSSCPFSGLGINPLGISYQELGD